MQSLAAPGADGVMLVVTHLGSEYAYVALLVVGYLALGPRAARAVGLTLLASYWLNTIAKGAFDTPRPFLADPDLLRSPAAGATAPGPGFPSGHAQLSTTFWVMTAGLVRRRPLTVLAVAVIVLVSFSRVYLGVHLAVDVVGGVLLGLACAAAGVALVRSGHLRLPPASPPRRALAIAAWCVVPFVLYLLHPLPDGDLILGGLAGFGSAPWWVRHVPPRGWFARAALAAAGLAVALGWLLGTGALLPEAWTDVVAVGYLRYLLLAWLTLAAVPWLARRREQGGGR